ncbi:MAG: DUF4249 domain-containing protein, partial [Odoribacter sp.]|nr:DUF4249 domain-containing protein [Odoribacter sp.]
MKRYLFIITVLFIITGCEKEIDINYRSVDKLYIVEGHVTNEVTEVVITQTRDMEDGNKGTGIDGARVQLSTGDGFTEILEYNADGYYRSPSGLTGIVGTTYSLSVVINESEFSSTSTMNEQVEIEWALFQWQKIMDEKVLFFRFSFKDIPEEENYYCYRIYRNEENYSWGVMRDKGEDGNSIIRDITCMTEKMANDNKEEDWDDILYENDRIELELQTIDKGVYDYLYSLSMSNSSSSNPIDNFSGGCLGYFAAYSTTRTSLVFHKDDIVE